MYVVTGATGHVGRIIAHRLLSQKHSVRVIGRDRQRLRLLESRGAEVCLGDVREQAFVERAFAGARAVFAMIPPDMRAPDYRAHQDRVTDQVTNAIRKNKVPYVVALSSLGAQQPNINGPIRGNQYMEQSLNEIQGLNVLHLRPGYFMTNVLDFVPMLKQRSGQASHAMPALVKLPWVAPFDIATAGATRLDRLDFAGVNAQELLGERDLTLEEIVRVLGQVLGIENAQYTQAPWDVMAAMLKNAGISDKTLQTMHENVELANQAALAKGVTRTSINTTETSIEEWAEQSLK